MLAVTEMDGEREGVGERDTVGVTLTDAVRLEVLVLLTVGVTDAEAVTEMVAVADGEEVGEGARKHVLVASCQTAQTSLHVHELVPPVELASEGQAAQASGEVLVA
jgi:hypothetical protein